MRGKSSPDRQLNNPRIVNWMRFTTMCLNILGSSGGTQTADTKSADMKTAETKSGHENSGNENSGNENSGNENNGNEISGHVTIITRHC